MAKSKPIFLEINEGIFLSQMAERLDPHKEVAPLTTLERATFAHILREFVKTLAPTSESILKETAAALSYTYLVDLSAGQVRRKIIRGRVADFFGMREQTVSNATTKYKSHIKTWSRMHGIGRGAIFTGKSQELGRPERLERLKRELLELGVGTLADWVSAETKGPPSGKRRPRTTEKILKS